MMSQEGLYQAEPKAAMDGKAENANLGMEKGPECGSISA
jgi:hypothetical protein